ncbi:MAG TPA: hypothetical protein ENI35_06840 [Candidatus Desulfofervidus auxilii]|uniref:Type II toxin-antitoxin system HicA family toxin n=1 Tax=Desulfofervidus auxilii TaxID=1621989 RepID=A0A7C1VV97_DESA2|nr:hypothetical protein [Candidatus Desulfofervidus auxilii]
MAKKKKREFYRKNFADLSIKIPWKYFKDILIKNFGFEMESKRGSVRVFVREDQRFTVHKPHGKGDSFVSKWARKRAIEVLDALGLLDKEN